MEDRSEIHRGVGLRAEGTGVVVLQLQDVVDGYLAIHIASASETISVLSYDVAVGADATMDDTPVMNTYATHKDTTEADWKPYKWHRVRKANLLKRVQDKVEKQIEEQEPDSESEDTQEFEEGGYNAFDEIAKEIALEDSAAITPDGEKE